MLFSVTVVILFVFFIVIVPMQGVLVLENVHAHAHTLIVYYLCFAMQSSQLKQQFMSCNLFF